MQDFISLAKLKQSFQFMFQKLLLNKISPSAKMIIKKGLDVLIELIKEKMLLL